MEELKAIILAIVAALLVYGSLRPSYKPEPEPEPVIFEETEPEEVWVEPEPEEEVWYEEPEEVWYEEEVWWEEPEVEEEVWWEEPEVEEVWMPSDEVYLIAMVTAAEAGIEPELGQRLVIDVVLNRVDSPQFPNDIYSVIYQPGQFACVSDGRIYECPVTDELLNLVYEEMQWRTNWDVHFFRTRQYSIYGEPLFQVEHHYFSK